MSRNKPAKNPVWTKIPWDGNPELNLECWRKSFGRGHVSVGVGEFLTIVFSFGADSEHSHSATRWNYGNPPISEQEAMDILDKTNAMDDRSGYRGFQHPSRKETCNE